MGLIDREKEKLKQEAKKKVLKLLLPKLIPIIIGILIFAVVGFGILSVFDAVTQKMGQLINVISTFTTNIWKWLTNDYWIDLTKEIEVDYEDEEGNVTTEKRTLIDQYMYKLDELGISLKDLRLLGDADYDDPDLLQNPTNKRRVQKYLKSFVVADLITSQIHRTRGTNLVDDLSQEMQEGIVKDIIDGIIELPENINSNEPIDIKQLTDINQILKYVEPSYWKIQSDKIDGGIYLYRTRDVITTTGTEEIEHNIDDEKMYYRMEYKELQQFRDMIDKYNQSGGSSPSKSEIEKCFAIDEEGNLLVAEVNGYVKMRRENDGPTIEVDRSYTAEIKTIDYKQQVAEFTLPYEFLVELCMVTQNPEFVFHVAQMSLNTRIDILLMNNETTIINKEVKTEKRTKEKKEADGSVKKESYTVTITTTTTETSTNPKLELKKANTWSNYKKVVWTSRVTEKTNIIEIPAVSTTTRTKITNEYSKLEGTLIRKSDNFLGLLRNKTGRYITGTTPNFKIDGCKFDRYGINVSYKIPGRSIYEDPLSKLRSGEQMLYGLLEQNERTQPLVELMKYYMSFPEQEYYELDEDEIEEILGGYSENNGNVQYDQLTDSEIEILYKICQAEAGGSSEEEIGHVASVILNRVKCSAWGNTIKDVVFQKSQFAPVSNGSYDKAVPSDKTKRAVDNVLANGDTTGGAVYFRTKASAEKAGIPTSSSQTHKTYIYLFTDPNTHVFLTNKKALEELKGTTAEQSKPSTGKLKDVFPDGIPTTREGIQKYLTTVSVPITTKNGSKTTKNITVHKDIADDLKNVLKKAQDEGFKVYDIQGFSWRKISGSTTMSQHSLGLAVDINVNENYCVYPNGKIDAGSFWKPGENEYSIPKNGVLVKAFQSIGWGWGGSWKSKKDYMHFSYTGG